MSNFQYQYNDSDPMHGGGGFSENQSPNAGAGFSSPGGGDGSSPAAGGNTSRFGNKDEQTVIPATVKMIIESISQRTPGGGSGNNCFAEPDGRKISLIKVIAAVRDNRHTNSFYVFNIEDGTGGTVEVRKHRNVDGSSAGGTLDAAVGGGGAIEEQIDEGMYIHVVGYLSEYENKKFIQAHSVRPISSSNQLTHHMLEVIYSYERHMKQQNSGGIGMMNPIYNPLPKQQGQSLQQQQQSNGGSMMMGGGDQQGFGGGSGGNGNNPNHSRIFQAMRELQSCGEYDELGWPRDVLVHRMNGEGIPESDVFTALSDAANDGMIYSTTDENHFTFTG